MALDFGTSNVHVTLVDGDTAEMILGTSRKYRWYTPGPNEIELNAEEVWKASETAVEELMRKLPENLELLAVTFSFLATVLHRWTRTGTLSMRCSRDFADDPGRK